MIKFHIVGGVVIVALAFFGGTKFGGNDNGGPARMNQGQFGDQQVAHDDGFDRTMQAGQGFVGGTILSVDENGITVQLTDGGSRIVFISSGTEITKSTDGTLEDLTVGEQVFITGTQNEDETVSAESVRIGGADFRVFQRPDGGDGQ